MSDPRRLRARPVIRGAMHRRQLLQATGLTAATLGLSGCQTTDNGEAGPLTGSVTVDVSPPRFDSYVGEEYLTIPIDVSGGYAGDTEVTTTLLNGNKVVKQINSLIEVAPPTRPIELRYTVDREITETRAELGAEPKTTRPPKEGVTVQFSKLSETGNKVLAQLKNTSPSSIEFTPVPVYLDGDTAIPLTLLSTGDRITLGSGEIYQYERDLYGIPPGPLSGVHIYPV